VAKQLRVTNETYFKIPCYDFFMQENHPQPDVNAVLLAMDDSSRLPLCLELQENITALMHACVNQDQSLVNYLLDHGACPNIQSSIQGYTALHLVCLSSHPLQVKNTLITLLRSNGARVDLSDKYNQSVVQLAQAHAPELSAHLTAKLNVGGGRKGKKRGTFFSTNDQPASITANEGQNVSYQLEKN
jgi:ankyrin repeat protein